MNDSTIRLCRGHSALTEIDYFPTTFESHNLPHFASFCLFC